MKIFFAMVPLQLHARMSARGWTASLRTEELKDRVEALALEPLDKAFPERTDWWFLSPEFEAPTRGQAEALALRWLAAELEKS